jgi:ATP-binding cassette subfamily B protein
MSMKNKAPNFLFNSLKPYYPYLTVMGINSLIWSIDLSLSPYLVKIIIDTVISFEFNKENLLQGIIPLILAYIALALTVTTSFRIYSYLIDIKMMPKYRKDVVSLAFKHLIGQDYRYFQKFSVGLLTRHMGELSTGAPEIVQILINRFFANSMALTIAIFTLASVQPKFALITSGWVILFIFASFILFKKLNCFVENWAENNAISSSFISDCLSNILYINLYSSYNFEQSSLRSVLDKVVISEKKLQMVYFFIWLIYSYSFNIIQGISLYFLALGYVKSQISVGDFALVLGINLSIVNFLAQMTQDFAQFTKHYGNVSQAIKIIMFPYDEKQKTKDLKIVKGIIEFKNVSFGYQLNKDIIKNINIKINSGECVGLVGFSGSGKSTLVNLLLGLYEPTNGEIFIDNQKISEFSKQSLRKIIGVVPQNIILFNRNIIDNIGYGKDNISLQIIREIAKKTYIDDLIPDDHINLIQKIFSGGQSQRIIIARMLLNNAPIIIMDEPTSSLDRHTAKKIESTLGDFLYNKTSIIISHDISFIKKLDRIIVFDNGRVVQEGNHKNLIKDKRGIYYQLAKEQENL